MADATDETAAPLPVHGRWLPEDTPRMAILLVLLMPVTIAATVGILAWLTSYVR